MPIVCNVLSRPGSLANDGTARMGLWLPLTVTQLGGWGQEWAGASEMLALTHKAHMTIPTFGQLHFP